MRAEQNLVMAPQTIASTPLPSQKDINFPRCETLKKSKAFYKKNPRKFKTEKIEKKLVV